MKKKILISIFIVAIVAIAGWNIKQNKNEVALSDVALENIEALASEAGPDWNHHKYDPISLCCVQYWPNYVCSGSHSGC